jgi:hypothetical protein
VLAGLMLLAVHEEWPAPIGLGLLFGSFVTLGIGVIWWLTGPSEEDIARIKTRKEPANRYKA